MGQFSDHIGPLAKDAKGTALVERRLKRRALDAHEKAEKRAVMVRDHQACRWPHCEFRTMRIPIEVAHLQHKSMGGNPANDRSERHLMLALCRLHHQGARSLHSGDLRVEPLTHLGTEGRLAFYTRAESGRWECIAIEKGVGVSEARGL